jgi:hypothetical protein
MTDTSEPVREHVAQLPTDALDMDDAWNYLNRHVDTVLEISDVDISRLRRKIDWRIVPIMFGCYTVQFLDKVILNYAAVMGLQKDLNMKGNQFSNIATFLFVGLLCFEVPNSTRVSIG